MTKIAIILGSTRPGRKGEPVARWVYDAAARRGDADPELADLADWKPPHLDGRRRQNRPQKGPVCGGRSRRCRRHSDGEGSAWARPKG
jgi:hypothetical protein